MSLLLRNCLLFADTIFTLSIWADRKMDQIVHNATIESTGSTLFAPVPTFLDISTGSQIDLFKFYKYIQELKWLNI